MAMSEDQTFWSGPTQSDARNSSADANAWTAKPSSLSKSGSDSRHGLVVIDDRHEVNV